MAKQTINIGSAELAGDGESLRSAFDKINDNFDDLYAANLSVDAQFLESQPGAYYLDYTNFVNTPQIPLDVSDLTDTTNLLSGGGSLSDTDGLSEGSTNLYYTDARVRAAVSGTIGPAGYDSSTGAFSIPGALTDLGITDGTNGQVLTTDGSGGFTFTTVSGGGAGIALSDLSVTTASAGTAALAYNNTTGVFTYTPPDLSSFSTFDGDYNNLTNKPTIPTAYTDSDVDAHLNQSNPTSGYVLSWNGSDYAWVAQSGGATTLSGLTDVDSVDTPTTGDMILWDGSEWKYILLEDEINTRISTQKYTDAKVDLHLNTSTATANQILSWNGTDYAWVAQSGSGGIALSDLSVTTASASGTPSLSYNNTTGVFTYTPPDLANAIVAQAQYTTTVTTNAADTSDTGARILGNTGSASATGSSTGWVFADIVQDPDNPGTTTILDVDNALLTGDVVGDITSSGTSQFSGTVDFSASSSVDFTGATVSGLSSGGQASRSTATGTTSSLADAAEADLDITGFKSYALLTITTDRAARVRLYVSAATRTADASRAEGTDPTSDAGLIAEVITTGAETVIISPGAFGFNLESTPTTTIPCRVTNKSGSSSTVQVDLNILQLEA